MSSARAVIFDGGLFDRCVLDAAACDSQKDYPPPKPVLIFCSASVAGGIGTLPVRNITAKAMQSLSASLSIDSRPRSNFLS